MSKIILVISKDEDGKFEASNGRYEFKSNPEETVENFRFRINKHFMNSKTPQNVYFRHEK